MTIIIFKLPKFKEASRMAKIGNKGRLVIALLLTFGVLAYLVQGEQKELNQAGVELYQERPFQQTGEYNTQDATKVTTPPADQMLTDPSAEEIFNEANSKAEGGTSFFIEYRLERDRQRSQQIALLKQIIDNPNSDTEGRQEAQKRLVELTQQMDLELQLEKLIVAKGYKDAALFIHPNAVNVIIMADSFNDQDANKIGDLVSRSTGRPWEQISMIVKK